MLFAVCQQLFSFFIFPFFYLSNLVWLNLFGKIQRKSAAIFFSLDYFIPLRDSTEMKIHFILSEKIEERLASFRLIISTAVEGCSYAEVRTALT